MKVVVGAQARGPANCTERTQAHIESNWMISQIMSSFFLVL